MDVVNFGVTAMAATLTTSHSANGFSCLELRVGPRTNPATVARQYRSPRQEDRTPGRALGDTVKSPALAAAMQSVRGCDMQGRAHR